MSYPTPNASHERRCHDCGNVAIHADRITPWVLCSRCGSQDTRVTAKPIPHEPTVPRAVADRLADKVATAIHRATNDAGYTADRLIRAEAEINGALDEYRKAVAGG